jgi:hypothetical protein
VLESGIPHEYADSRLFRKFLAVSCPGYDFKSPRTIKMRILQTYAVLKHMVANTFRETVDSKFSITFDGWSNSSLQGFYTVTIYLFADEKAQDALLDFFYVTPGRQVSKRCAEYILGGVDEFGISSRLISTVYDNGSDAVTARGGRPRFCFRRFFAGFLINLKSEFSLKTCLRILVVDFVKVQSPSPPWGRRT